jgi:hypothetical protein
VKNIPVTVPHANRNVKRRRLPPGPDGDGAGEQVEEPRAFRDEGDDHQADDGDDREDEELDRERDQVDGHDPWVTVRMTRGCPRWRAGRGFSRCEDARARLTVSARMEKAANLQPPRFLPGNCEDSVMTPAEGVGRSRAPHDELGGRCRWLPVLLAVLAADVNFWYFASTGENDADYLGIGLFVIRSSGVVGWRWPERGAPWPRSERFWRSRR